MRWLACLMLLPAAVFADFSQMFLKQFPNDYYVETGTAGGRSIKWAIRCGFKNIRSVDVNPVPERLYSLARHVQELSLYTGDSGELLEEMIEDIEVPITFWLDAHVYPPKEGQKNCPILEELEVIRGHYVKEHTILIDDITGCGTLEFDYVTLDQIKEKLLEINPSYKIRLVPGGWHDEVKDNILVATP